MVFVDRSTGDSRKATMDAIEKHCTDWKVGSRPLLIFPEGTTTNGEGLVDFKRGAFVSGVPVRPVVTVYTGQFDPATTTYVQAEGDQDAEVKKTSDAEWAAQFMGHFIHSMHIRVLPPYIPSEEEKRDPDLYASRCRSYMEIELVRVRDELFKTSWKAMAGREDGGLDYKFGDVTRWVMKTSVDMVCCFGGPRKKPTEPTSAV